MKTMSYMKKQESMAQHGVKEPTETVLEEAQMLNLFYKDFNQSFRYIQRTKRNHV